MLMFIFVMLSLQTCGHMLVNGWPLGSIVCCVFLYFCHFSILGHWLDMVYLPPRGNFVDHIFLEAQCLARILQHISPLTMAALSCNSLLHTLPYKIFDN